MHGKKNTSGLVWNSAKIDLEKKVNEILKKQQVTNKQLLKDLIKENPSIVDKFIAEGEKWDIPKDIACALFQRSKESWGPLGCSPTTKRKSNAFTNFILGKLYWR